MFTTLIDAADLATILKQSDLIILDCRAKLGEPEWGAQAYAAGHIEGAQFASLDHHLAAPPDHRGRHPLPELHTWVAQVRAWGISNDTQVVVYDDAQGAYAARAWWMLRWVGHAQVAVLNGGLTHWPHPLTTDAPLVQPSQFEPRPALTALIDADALLDKVTHGQTGDALIDARTQARWAGEQEPIDPVAGHIPGARCLPFQGNLAADGTWLSADELAARFEHLPDPVICYCGSGVTACHNLLALALAGREGVLFADSWSGWITDPQRPVATAEL